MKILKFEISVLISIVFAAFSLSGCSENDSKEERVGSKFEYAIRTSSVFDLSQDDVKKKEAAAAAGDQKAAWDLFHYYAFNTDKTVLSDTYALLSAELGQIEARLYILQQDAEKDRGLYETSKYRLDDYHKCNYLKEAVGRAYETEMRREAGPVLIKRCETVKPPVIPPYEF